MKFSVAWLREWVDPSISTDALAEQLTMLGLEVDSVSSASLPFSRVVFGQIIKAVQHPNADRLRCCQVRVDADTVLDIVCGAPNAREGIRVAVAMVGATLPGDFKISKSKLRGEPSHGMLCSAKELGIEAMDPDGTGIIEFPDDVPLGHDIRQYFELDDDVIDIELTPNRGDAACLLGIAREVALANETVFTEPEIKELTDDIADQKSITLAAPAACPRYVGRVIKGINSAATTPIWMQERLRRSGLRIIHPVVDVLNYVMLELGQPMHAFDLATLQGDMQVRMANNDESITLLDDQEITLDDNKLVIADDSGPLAIAGIMGGACSGVTASTCDIFLESAYFDPVTIRLGARAYGLQSDSSYRFERGVDYALQHKAMVRASMLLKDIVGGHMGPITEVKTKEHLPVAPVIDLPVSAIARHLGIAMNSSQVVNIFKGLGFDVVEQEQAWQLTPPSFRFDITQPIDLIEELARVYGYDQIAPVPERIAANMRAHSQKVVDEDKIKSRLMDMGYQEVITYSFVSSEFQRIIVPDEEALTLSNPISADLDVMRRSLLPGLLKAAVYNQNRQVGRLRLCEIGRCFLSHEGDDQAQPLRLGLLSAGDFSPEQWGEASRPVDFFDMKHDVTSLLAFTRREGDFRWERSSHPALHPAQSATLFDGDRPVGHLGVIHPRVASKVQLKLNTVLFEMDLAVILSSNLTHFESLGRFPAVRRDLALIVDESVSIEQICQEINESSGLLLDNCRIFDIYQGEGIEKGKKSIALGLTFRDSSRTLVDTEINDIVHGVVESLQRRFNATLRA